MLSICQVILFFQVFAMGRAWHLQPHYGKRRKCCKQDELSRARSFVVESGALAVGQEDATLIDSEQLTAEQRLAAGRVMSGENLFLTGAAGTGKSFLLRFLIQELESRYPGEIGITAPTGIASANIGGQTIHSFAGVGLGEGSPQGLLAKVRKSHAATSRWKKIRVLIIDEVSMLDSCLFESLEIIAASIRGVREGKRFAAFGNIQLLMCGDFLQLPPVHVSGSPPKQFCFQSPAWTRCGLDRGIVNLLEAVRQACDLRFASILGEIRVGVVSVHAQSLLAQCHVGVKELPRDDITPTKLYCLNKNVDAENTAQLAELPGSATTFRAVDTFQGVPNLSQRESMQIMLEKLMPAEVSLKIGAQVILIKNNPVLKLVNGSRGVVASFSGNYPIVRFDNGCSARIGQETFVQGTVLQSMKRLQVPLKLGWALTVHKAQGMNLSRAELQVDDAFEPGQAYVALSRLTCLEGLWIRGKGLSTSNTRAHETVLDFYNSSAMKLLQQDPIGPPPPSLSERLGFWSYARVASAQARESLDKAEQPVKKRQRCVLHCKVNPTSLEHSTCEQDTCISAPNAMLAMPKERLLAELARLRLILDDLESTSAQLAGALETLRLFGSVSAKYILETQIHQSVGALVKRYRGQNSSLPLNAAKLLESWKHGCKTEKQQKQGMASSPASTAASTSNKTIDLCNSRTV